MGRLHAQFHLLPLSHFEPGREVGRQGEVAAGLDLLKQIVEAIALPIIAIGGITADNAPPVIKAGVHGLAVISAVCCQNDPAEAARCLRRLMEAEPHA